MIRINLLPIRAAQKRVGAKNELIAVAMLLLVTVVALYAWHLVTAVRISALDERVADVRGQIADLKKDVVRIEQFKTQMKVLEQKIEVIKQLESQRVGPARMLDDLATILTEQKKVWLTSIEERAGQLTLEGVAMEHENVSDFQLAMQRRSQLFRDIKLQLVTTAKEGSANVLRWKLTCVAAYGAG
ncbi:MAG: PilN domain-containing protein [Myxococcota bacterium]